MIGQRGARGVLVGAAILAVAAALVCGILLGARPLMLRVVPHLGGGAAASAPLVETLFNLLVFGLILVAAAVGGAVERRNAFAPGARAALALPSGLAIGLAGISVSALYAKLAGTLVPGAGGAVSLGLLLWGAAVVLFQTVAEEAYFRGWLQPALASRWGLAAALVATSLAFAALHVAGGARGTVSLLNLFLGGLVFGLLAARGRGLAAAIGAHFAWNVVEQLGYGLDPNPGTGSFGSMRDWDLVGAAQWGGSEEGLNASLGTTFALLAILVPLAMTGWRSLVAAAAAPSGAARPAAV